MSRHLSPYPRFALLLGLVLSLFGLSAGAATFIVTNLNDSGPGSLRQAVFDANAAEGDDTIIFQSGLSGAIALTSGEVKIASNIAINGPGANVLAVSGSNVSGVFVIECGGWTVSIDGLTIKDGNGFFGGEILGGGGIRNEGGTLTISNSIISGNLSSEREGGGIYNPSVSCELGSFSGRLTVINSTVSGNTAASGGGIYNGAESTATIINSTLSGNSANGGGPISNITGGGIVSGDTLTISNSTISGNSSLENCGGIAISGSSTLTLGNSVVAGNTAPYGKELCNSAGPGYPPGVFTSQGHNIFGENGISGVEGGTLAPTDIVPTVGISAILAPLGNYGGPTQTHLLVPGSPAINAGDNALIPAGVTTDQRGFPRIQGGTVDIGAVEAGETSTTDIPTLSQWALLLAGLLLAGIAWRALVGRLPALRR